MPSAPKQLQNEWPGQDAQAIKFLLGRGFKMTKGWCWIKPPRAISNKEVSAINYLCQEWDFGGLVT